MASFLAKGGSLLAEPQLPDWAADDDAPSTKPEDDPTEKIPGYTGWVPNAKEVAAVSYSKAAKRALTTDIQTLLEEDQIPPAPHATDAVKPVPTDTVVGLAEAAPRHMPGYTGFVPATRDTFGSTYGQTTTGVSTQPVAAQNGRKALNAASLQRASRPVTYSKPEYDIKADGLTMKFAPS